MMLQPRLGSVVGAGQQAARIEKVLRAVIPLRPTGARLEFNSEKIADFAENTVFDFAGEFAVRVTDEHRAAQGNGPFDLEARAGDGNILKVRDTSPQAAVLVAPLDVDQVRAQQSRFYSAIYHN